MRILFICNYSLLFGANRSLLSLLEYLTSKNFDVLVLLPSHGPFAKTLEAKNLNYRVIRFFPSFLYFKFMFKYLLLPILIIYNIIVFPKLVRFVKSYNPDLIYSNTSAENFGIVLSKFLKIKHISHIREFMSLDHGAFFVFGRRLKSIYIRKSEASIFVSKAVRSYVMMDEVIDENTNPVIYNGIDVSATRISPKTLPVKVKFASVGVLQPSKGHHIAIDMFSKYVKENPNSELHIYGDGYNHYRNKLIKKIKSYKLENKIFLEGFFSDIEKIYTNIDVLLVCSRAEGFGRVTIEAMGYGVPVLGFNNGGTKELIRHNVNGYLFSNYEEFREAAEELFETDEKYNLIRFTAYQDAFKNFSVNTYVKKVEELVLSV